MDLFTIDRFRGILTEDERGGNAENAHPDSTDFWLRPGNTSVRNRKGFDLFEENLTADYTQLFVHSSGTLLARRGTTLVEVDVVSGESATATVTDAFTSFTRVGTPSVAYTLIADGTLALKTFDDASNFTSGAAIATVDGSGAQAMPKGMHLATDPDSNRLVVAGTATSGGPAGATSSGSHVWFSEPGNPLAWTSTNFVQVSPGDGESICGAIQWNGQIFVFKPSTLFVFYGEDTDADGSPIFNYRTIALGPEARILTPVKHACNGTVTKGPDSVYYLSGDAVWGTTGDAPYLVSRDLADVRFSPTPTAYSGTWNSNAGIHYHVGKVYVAYNTSANSPAQYVIDVATGDVSKMTAGVRGFVSWNAAGTDTETELFSSAGGTSQGSTIVAWSTASGAYDDDDGTAITATWKSQWSDLDYYGEKRISNIEVWGSGAVKLTVLSDFYESGVQGKTTSTTSMTLGASDDNNFRRPAKAVFKESISGNYFSLKFESNGSNADWQIDRVTIFYEPRDPRATRADSNN